jgi:hypothetical protein
VGYPSFSMLCKSCSVTVLGNALAMSKDIIVTMCFFHQATFIQCMRYRRVSVVLLPRSPLKCLGGSKDIVVHSLHMLGKYCNLITVYRHFSSKGATAVMQLLSTVLCIPLLPGALNKEDFTILLIIWCSWGRLKVSGAGLGGSWPLGFFPAWLLYMFVSYVRFGLIQR